MPGAARIGLCTGWKPVLLRLVTCDGPAVSTNGPSHALEACAAGSRLLEGSACSRMRAAPKRFGPVPLYFCDMRPDDALRRFESR